MPNMGAGAVQFPWRLWLLLFILGVPAAARAEHAQSSATILQNKGLWSARRYVSCGVGAISSCSPLITCLLIVALKIQVIFGAGHLKMYTVRNQSHVLNN